DRPAAKDQGRCRGSNPPPLRPLRHAPLRRRADRRLHCAPAA
ncbi:MAG: hypothetical protein AVDCRST_MAG04-2875, partial [uncultured Acetobacteraceae bacterium]